MSQPLSLFEGFGIEIEYMIVDSATLHVRPICDRLFTAVKGELVDEITDGPIAWSNELASHVVELKTNGPTPQLNHVHQQFSDSVAVVNDYLKRFRARLLGTGMHPWMQPDELRLWPGGQNEVYEAYDRIFNCKGHGWANLQSVHINLPFANDDELARLHGAVRLLLPVLPALSASTPLVEGRRAGFLDYRMEVYRNNAKRIPNIAGRIVPEDIGSRAEYESLVLQPMYAAIAPHDTGHVLQEEWLNSRGAIVRFDRHAIEIRVVDTQECPKADFAIVEVVVALLRRLVDGKPVSGAAQRAFSTDVLGDLFLQVIRDGEATMLPAEYVAALTGLNRAMSAQELWTTVSTQVNLSTDASEALDVILNQGCLARRILRALHDDTGREATARLYRRLADCLSENRVFVG